MRPIKLKISGLNSYIETQTIDFSRLTERGLFGIFGPTGCGKSTILDAIILSLYGHKGQKGIPRSTSEFINTAVDQASISYSFGLDTEEGPRVVLVERKFKRTDTGLSTSFSRLQMMTEDGVVIEVFDKTTDVTNQVVDLLGLTREDFMRSVVLPQGKFSEFLTLEGKERRDMLERLLDLKSYGSALQMKIKRRGDLVKERMLQMEGEMKRYSDLSKESVDQVRDDLEVSKKAEIELEANFKALESKRNDAERLYTVIKSLRENNERLKELESKQSAMELEKDNITKAEAAENIWPYYLQYSQAVKTAEGLRQELKATEDQYSKSKTDYEAHKEEYDQFMKVFDRSKEDLAVKKSNIETAKEHQIKANALTQERDALIKTYKGLQAESQTQLKDIEEKQQALAEAEKKALELAGAKDHYVTSSEERERILDGLRKEESHKKHVDQAENIKSVCETLSKKAKVLAGNLESRKSGLDDLKKDVNQWKTRQDKAQERYNEIPAEKSLLEIGLNQKETELKSLLEKLSEKEQLEKGVESLENTLEDDQKKNEALEKAFESAKKAFENADKKRLEYWTERVLYTLSDSLKEDAPCPLCGSQTHPHVHKPRTIESASDWSDVENALRQSQIDLDKSRAEIQLLLRQIKEQKEKLEPLSNVSQEMVHKLKAQIETTRKTREALHLEQGELKESLREYGKNLAKAEESVEIHQRKTSDARTEMAKLEAQLSEKQSLLLAERAEIDQIGLDLGLTEVSALHPSRVDYIFKDKYETLKKKDTRLAEIEKELTQLSDKTKGLRDALEILKTNNHKIQMEMNGIVEKGSGLKDRIAGHESEVKKVVGDLSLDQAYKDVLTKFEDLVKTQTNLEKAQARKEAHYRALESDLGALKGKMSQSEEALIEGKDKLDSALENSIIETMEGLKASHIEKETLAKRKAAFNAYMESLSILKDRINELDKERAGRNLTEDEWQAMNQAHKDAQTALNEEREKRISLSEKLKSLEAEMKRFESTLKRYAKYEKVQDLVQDLLDLVRGNKFVEFVAVTHLKYIALDASRRLMDITNHRYSLELDTKGNFIICDHYNGGVKRDTKTLSGGETFLTALSLSLALSSQIQLKGRTNLEFFFLDEGFGTLDNELLDIVMTSLEKLFHEKLTVGIISHVDELKNRVPIKLSVEPAKAGVHGTITRIEVT